MNINFDAIGGISVASVFQDITGEKMEQKWLIYEILPEGHLVLLAGESGIGKSSLTAYLATLVSKELTIAFYLLEDGPQTYINKIGLHENINYLRFQDDNGYQYLPKVSEIIEAIKEHHIDLLVIDPIAILANDINDNAKVRALLTPLQDACNELGCTVLGVHHFSKGNGRVKDRATGAHAWVATPRHVLSLVADKDKRVYLEVTKSNIGPTGHSWEAIKEVDRYSMRVKELVEAEEGSAQRALKSLYEDHKENGPDKVPDVIKYLKQEFSLGEVFTIDDVKRLGNLKTFYNYYNTHPELFESNKDPRNYKAGEKKNYWFKP